MRLNRLVYALLLVLIVHGFSLAQEREVKGTVRDSNGLEMLSVAVVVKGEGYGTETNLEGKYTIKVADGKTLEFSFLGMKTKRFKVNGQSRIDVVMEEEAQAIDEVVVVGYGTGRKIGTVVGSVVHLGGKEVAHRPSATLTDALQGKVAGVQVVSNSGSPNAAPSVTINGTGSLGSSSQPLYVVDGIIIESGGMLSLNSGDIESISVLKDASTTSIYGSRAANGVIYITTKRGENNTKGVITINSLYGISNIANRTLFDNMMSSDELTKFWVERGVRTQAQMDALRARYPHNTRWDKVFFREDMPTRQLDLSISGGSDKTRYYISGGYYDQQGIMHRSGFERYTLRSNIETRVNDWFRIGINATGAYYYSMNNAFENAANTNGPLGYFVPPFYSPVDENGKEYELIPGWGRYHPNYYAKTHPNRTEGFEIIPTGFVEITPIKGLTFKTQAGMQFDNAVANATELPSYLGNPKKGSVSKTYSKGLIKTLTNTLEYKFSLLNKHNFVALLGQETSNSNKISIGASGKGLTDDDMILLSNTTEKKDVSEGVTISTINSVFGRVEYDYDNKYFLDFSLRRDGSSKFSPNHKYANFWAAGAMWKLKKEKFLEDSKVINDLNLKFSLGTSGNSAIGDYTYQALVDPGQYNGKLGLTLSSSGNPELTWEEQKKYILGITSQLFNRVTLNVDLYRRISSEMLLNVPMPYTTGFSSVKQNVGKLQNQGIDVTFSIEAYKNKAKDIYITPYFNFGYNQEKVLELFNGKDSWNSYIGRLPVLYKVGESIRYYLPIYKGVNPDNGKPEWYLPGEDSSETTKDENRLTSVYSGALAQNVGKSVRPPLNGGFGLTANYKSLSLEANFNFSAFKTLYNEIKYFLHNPGLTGAFNQHRDNFDYWKQPGDKATFPRIGYAYTEDDSSLVEDASYIRLKTLTLAYSLPKETIKQIGFFRNVRVYATGRNILTWTKFSGIDPEIGLYTYADYPNTKQYLFGVELKF